MPIRSPISKPCVFLPMMSMRDRAGRMAVFMILGLLTGGCGGNAGAGEEYNIRFGAGRQAETATGAGLSVPGGKEIGINRARAVFPKGAQFAGIIHGMDEHGNACAGQSGRKRG